MPKAKKSNKKQVKARVVKAAKAKIIMPHAVGKAGTLRFLEAFVYPFARPKGMLNILWLLVPIFGWFALLGYSLRIICEFTEGKFKEMPVMQFSEDMKHGFWMTLKAIPFVMLLVVINITANELIASDITSTVLLLLIDLFIMPMLIVNFIKKQTIISFFEIEKVKYVFMNLWDYIKMMLKSMALGLIFLALCIVLVGLPANIFTKYIFFADFYRRHVKE